MHAAQQLLKQQHPHMNRLQDPLLQITNSFGVQTVGYVQCLNLGHKHWITVCTIGCSPSAVSVYYKRSMDLSSSLRNAFADLVHSDRRQIMFEYMNIQPQKGSNDCGLFVFANATTLCHGENPVTCVYNQEAMLGHLLKALELKVLVPLPAKKTKTWIKRECLCREYPLVHCT